MSRLLPLLACLSLAACASNSNVAEEVQRFYPGTEQIEAHYTRTTLDDGTTVKQGAVEQFHPNGQPKLTGAYDINGAPDGRWVTYFTNGQKSREGVYVSGLREGEWTMWGEKGALLGRSFWHNGVLDGPITTCDEQGRTRVSGTYLRGHREGLWTIFFANGSKRLAGRFERDKPQGRWTAWYSDGTRAGEGTYHNGDRDGLWICWAEDGTILTKQQYKDDAPTGQSEIVSAGWDSTVDAPVSDPFDFATIFSALSSTP